MNSARLLTWAFAVVGAVAAAGQVAHSHNHDRIGYVSHEIMERPVPLRAGIGAFHQPVSTASAQAQKFYDQGQSYLHSYMWIEAARSFHQALRLDPKLAMAYVGLSYAYSPLDYTAARNAVVEADDLAHGVSDVEKGQIEIRERQLNAMTDPQSSDKLLAFRKAIDATLAANPNDPELLLLRGNAEEPTPFGDGQGCVRSAIPYYNKVLGLSPDNFAAHHYLAHCYENIGLISEALVHAETYTHLAPAIAHAHHMWGHELRRSGRTEEAIAQFQKADQIERRYYLEEKVPDFLDWHHAHNLALLANCYQSIGRMKDAERLLREEISLPAFTDYAMLNRSNWALFLINRGRFKEAEAAAGAMIKLPSPLARAAGYALAGQAAINLGLQDKAAKHLAEAGKTQTQLSPEDQAAVQSYITGLSAMLNIIAGAREQGEMELRDAVRRIRAAGNPDSWAQGLFQLEMFAAFARKHGQWKIAQEIAQALREHDPHYAGSHFELALVAQHRNDALTAKAEFAAAARLWSGADRDLPEFVYALHHSNMPPQSDLRVEIQKIR
jgi:tetratricopeptide (TPR) repeat protein